MVLNSQISTIVFYLFLAFVSRDIHDQSTDSISGSIVSECRLGKWSLVGTKTVSFNPLPPDI